MKKSIVLIVSIILAFSFQSCNENMPVIPCLTCDDGGGPPIPPEARKVVIEEFTGVRCVNCPQGSAEIENLLAVYGEQLIAISLHAGFFSNPYPSQEDFRTEEGTQILDFLGQPLGFPTAVVNRKQFDGEDDLQLGQASWGGYIAQELNTESKFVLDIENDFNSDNFTLDVKVLLTPIEDFTGDVKLTLLITESGIISRQLTPDGDNLDYEHKHMLRKIVTPFDGEAINELLSANQTVEKNYSVDIPLTWNPAKLSIIAFVQDAGATKEIFQADESKIEQ